MVKTSSHHNLLFSLASLITILCSEGISSYQFFHLSLLPESSGVTKRSQSHLSLALPNLGMYDGIVLGHGAALVGTRTVEMLELLHVHLYYMGEASACQEMS